MKITLTCIIAFVILLSYQPAFCQTLGDYIKKAESFNQAGNLEEAAKVMEEAIQKFPEQLTTYSYLGLYRGTQAGTTPNYMEAGRLVGVAFEMLDKAVSMDADNPIARFHRGLMGVKVPTFLGRLDQGIQDLEFLLKLHEKSKAKVPSEIIPPAYNFLAEGYLNKQEHDKAITAWSKVIELAPDSPLANQAKKNISNLTEPKSEQKITPQTYTANDVENFKQQVSQNPDHPALLTQLGKAYVDTRDFENAEKVLKKAISKDSTNIRAYKLLIQTVGELAGQGYDKRIYDDTDYRTKLAFEIMNLVDRAVKIAPGDMELRVIRGSIGVMMPFFVGRLDQAMDDLSKVIASDTDDETMARANYWLGRAYQKKATTQWIKVITDYKKTSASNLTFASMRPAIKHLDPQKYQKPFVAIDFVLGFRDELAPQTAIWIENSSGDYITTIYVSGFSGHAKEKQVNLSEWAKSSKFQNIDAVTVASIDIGHHIYIWNLTDHQGKKVKSGEYKVNIEVAFWPSMEYQHTSAKITIGSKDSKIVVEEGDIIPYLEVKSFVK